MTPLSHLTGQETMSTLRKMVKNSAALFEGIKLSGKGRTKQVIADEMNARIRMRNVQVQKMQIHECDMNLKENKDCPVDSKMLRGTERGIRRRMRRKQRTKTPFVTFAQIILFLVLWRCIVGDPNAGFSDPSSLAFIPQVFPFLLVASFLGTADTMQFWTQCFMAFIPAIVIADSPPLYLLFAVMVLICAANLI